MRSIGYPWKLGLILTLVLPLSMASPAQASQGVVFEPAFGNHGTLVPPHGLIDASESVAADGAIYVQGGRVIERWDATGKRRTLDPRASGTMLRGRWSLDDQGRIVARRVFVKTMSIELQRFEADGAPDKSFGFNGDLVINLSRFLPPVTDDCSSQSIEAGVPSMLSSGGIALSATAGYTTRMGTADLWRGSGVSEQLRITDLVSASHGWQLLDNHHE